MTNPNAKSAAGENANARHYYWLGLAVVALAFIVAAALTWRRWPDVLVDYGTQLYMPWRIANGAVLYRDLFYFSGGPFSQYFNALLFNIFGVSFSTLFAANLAFAAAMVCVVYRGFASAAGILTATLICLGVVLVFVFGQYTLGGNYNFIAPYTQESTHGIIFSIAAIACLSDWIQRNKVVSVGCAGFCTGLVFLTKPDIFVALAGTAVAGFIIFYLTHALKNVVKSLGIFLLAGMVPPLFFFLYFLHQQSVGESLRAIAFDWVPVFQGVITKNAFYRWCTGLDYPMVHLEEIVGSFLAVIVVLAVYAWVLRWAKHFNSKWIRSPYVTVLILISPLLAWAGWFDWRQCGWPLPLLGLSTCALIAWNYKKLERPPAFPLLWSLFGLALLAKLGLFPRISHYGFALAMPAFASMVYLLFWLLPTLLEKKWGVPSREFRIMTGLVLLVGIGNLFDQAQWLYAKKTLPIGSGGDQILTYNTEEGAATAAALAWAQSNVPPDATMAVLPDAIMFNYLARRVNPTPCLFWDPNSIGVYGQATMVAAFEAHPPDYIFLVQRDSSEFGKGYFGSSPDFGLELMQWVQKNYQPLVLIGHEPLKNELFGIEVLKRLREHPQ